MFVSSVSTIFVKTKKQTIMKTIYFTVISLFIALLSFGFSACSDDTDKILVDEEGIMLTRTDESVPTYYWDGRSEVPIRLADNKSYVVFHQKDKQTVIEALAKRGIKVNEANIHQTCNAILENPSEAVAQFSDCFRVGVDADYQTILEIPEVVYAYPYISIDGVQNPQAFTNCFYVQCGGGEKLYNMAAKYNVSVLGRIKGLTGVYLLWCTRESEGNAVTIANAFYKSELFDSVSPVIADAIKMPGVLGPPFSIEETDDGMILLRIGGQVEGFGDSVDLTIVEVNTDVIVYEEKNTTYYIGKEITFMPTECKEYILIVKGEITSRYIFDIYDL